MSNDKILFSILCAHIVKVREELHDVAKWRVVKRARLMNEIRMFRSWAIEVGRRINSV